MLTAIVLSLSMVMLAVVRLYYNRQLRKLQNQYLALYEQSVLMDDLLRSVNL